ncbi:MAG TPA: DUF2934 domain-containing protein [Methylococcaceae bacterium]|jgi:hypothetical protein|nr:DUF2934 domain-containing protein [Methylococcaceae bacterium]
MATALRKSSEEDLVTSEAEKPIVQLVDAEGFPVDPELFNEMVAERAYYKAKQRGFEPGHETEDWLEAEKELLATPAFTPASKSKR